MDTRLSKLVADYQRRVAEAVAMRTFELALGPEARRWWVSLNAFWEGKIPHVGADVTKGS